MGTGNVVQAVCNRSQWICFVLRWFRVQGAAVDVTCSIPAVDNTFSDMGATASLICLYRQAKNNSFP